MTEGTVFGWPLTIPVSEYGMHYDTNNAQIIARAQNAGEEAWNALPVTVIPARTLLNAHEETVSHKNIRRIVSGKVRLRDDYEVRLWDSGEKLYIVDGHTRTAIYHVLNREMPVRIMDEKTLPE